MRFAQDARAHSTDKWVLSCITAIDAAAVTHTSTTVHSCCNSTRGSDQAIAAEHARVVGDEHGARTAWHPVKFLWQTEEVNNVDEHGKEAYEWAVVVNAKLCERYVL
jgi:hypothetical protein